MRAVRIRVTADLIRDALKFPENAEVVYIGNYEFGSRTVEITMTHPELPDVKEGQVIPEGIAIHDSKKGITALMID